MKKIALLGYFLVLVLLIVTLFHYNSVYLDNKKFDMISNPEKYHGINKQFMGKYGESFNGGFYLVYNEQLVPIHYSEEYSPPHFGNVLVYGTFNKEGYVEAIGVHNYQYNYIIYLISLIAFLFVVWLFFKEWKIISRGFKSA